VGSTVQSRRSNWLRTPLAPPPPSPAGFPAKDIDSILLTAAEMSSLLGIKVTNNTADGSGALKMDASSYGTSDHSAQVTPRPCAGVAFTAEHDVYDGTNFQAIKTQSFSSGYGGSGQSKGLTRYNRLSPYFLLPT
jgi:hypothetical protein